jgi:hypothetical protein
LRQARHDFQPQDLVGGNLAVDFVNTVTARDTTPSDWVDGYGALLKWAALTGAFAKKDLAELGALAAAEPGQAASALRRCRMLREALCRVLYALIGRRAPPGDALAVIDEARLAAAKAAKLTPSGGRLVAQPSVRQSGLDLILHVVTAREFSVALQPTGTRLQALRARPPPRAFAQAAE